MRCYICDTEDDTIQFDYKDQRYQPCWYCREMIFDMIMDYEEPDDDQEDTITDKNQNDDASHGKAVRG